MAAKVKSIFAILLFVCVANASRYSFTLPKHNLKKLHKVAKGTYNTQFLLCSFLLILFTLKYIWSCLSRCSSQSLLSDSWLYRDYTSHFCKTIFFLLINNTFQILCCQISTWLFLFPSTVWSVTLNTDLTEILPESEILQAVQNT